MSDKEKFPNLTDDLLERIITSFVTSCWKPEISAYDPNNQFIIMSSQEIVLALNEIVDVDINTVARAMDGLGFRAVANQDSSGWLMYCK